MQGFGGRLTRTGKADATNANFPNPWVGDTVCIPIPAVGRGKTDPRSILACVIELTRDKFYRLRTHDGIFNCFYAHSQCRFCHEKFVEVEKIPTTYISLRTTSLLEVEDRVLFDAIAQVSVQSEEDSMYMLQKRVLCNSRCHSSNPCENKQCRLFLMNFFCFI